MRSAEPYLGIHQRLDRDTSGVLVFTRRKEANRAVAEQFEGRHVKKTYVAAVLGRPLVDDEHSSRKSAQGTYQSITLTLWMTSGDQVYAVYAALGADERVKYLL